MINNNTENKNTTTVYLTPTTRFVAGMTFDNMLVIDVDKERKRVWVLAAWETPIEEMIHCLVLILSRKIGLTSTNLLFGRSRSILSPSIIMWRRDSDIVEEPTSLASGTYPSTRMRTNGNSSIRKLSSIGSKRATIMKI